jgi:hypothetical protein
MGISEVAQNRQRPKSGGLKFEVLTSKLIICRIKHAFLYSEI